MKSSLFRELGHVLLDDEIEDPDVRAISFERVPKRCCKALAETQGLIRPRPDEAIDFGKVMLTCVSLCRCCSTPSRYALKVRIIPYSERLRCSAISIVCQRGGRCQKMHLWRS